jgi:hypothetical protein
VDDRLERIAQLMKALDAVTDQASGLRADIVSELQKLRAHATRNAPVSTAADRRARKRRTRKRRATRKR